MHKCACNRKKEDIMANIDKVIEVLCEDICKRHEQMTIKDLSDLTKSLSVLVMAKSKMGQSEIDINEIAFRMSSNILKQLNESKAGGTRAKRKEMSDQDLHCVTRLLQSALFADSIFYGCQYCKYYNNCFPDGAIKNHDMHYDKIMKKLQDITGIDVSPCCNPDNLEAKFRKHQL